MFFLGQQSNGSDRSEFVLKYKVMFVQVLILIITYC